MRLSVTVSSLLTLCFLFGQIPTAHAEPNPDLLPVWRDIFMRPDTSLAAIPSPTANPLTPAKILLGGKLFFDTRLSADNTRSCATCHEPARAFTDGRQRSTAIDGKTQLLNAPSLFNLAWAKNLFHDARASSLEDQARQPVNHPQEMAGSWSQIIDRLSADPAMTAEFQDAFPEEPVITQQNIIAAIAAYERTLISPKTRFDRFIAGDDLALSALEQAGFRLFVGKAGCISCHSGWRLSDGKVHNIGIAANNSPDAANRAPLIRTPGLRGISKTAPYMHDGSLPTLQRVMAHYLKLKQNQIALSPNLVRPLRLSDAEKDALLAFLRTLD